MEAVWPNVHVGEDNLFQCIREIRTALGDDKREMVRVISGRGYLFEAEVTEVAAPAAPEEATGRPAHVEPGARGRRNERRTCQTPRSISAGGAARRLPPPWRSPFWAARSPSRRCAPA